MLADALLLGAGGLLAAAWLALALKLGAAARQVDDLDERLASLGAGLRPARLSVVVTARDEAEAIGATLEGLARQELDGLEVIVVNDRSRDATARRIESALARLDPGRGRFSVIHNDVLPSGWLGKSHACHIASLRASGDWLLFMDADVVLARSDLLALCLSLAESQGLDHIAVLPDLGPGGPLRGALLALFGQAYLLATRSFEMKRDLPRGGVGVGAFNLVRRSAYERVGGHARLRLDPADDVKLGMLLKAGGARQRLLNGRGVVHCAWHASAMAIVRGLEKNLFAGLGYSLSSLCALTLGVLALELGPAVLASAAVLTAPPGIAVAACLGPAVQAGAIIAGHRLVGRRFGTAALESALRPVAAVLLLLAAWRSAYWTLRRGGIEWRGTRYPLGELRAGLVRPGRERRRG